MRKALICVLVAMFSVAAIAQQSASTNATSASGSQPLPPNAASREKVLQLLNLMNLKKTTDIAMRTAMQQAKTTATQGFLKEMPDATPDQLKHFSNMLEGSMQDIFDSMHFDEMIEIMIPIYQRHFTNADMDAVLAFYASPAGQKFLNETPQIMQESMIAMGPLQQKMMQEMMQKLRQRTEKLMEDEKKSANPSQSSRN